MKSKLEKIITTYIDNEHLVNKIVVTAFIQSNELEVNNNQLIKSCIIKPTDSNFLEIDSLFKSFSFEQVIEAFEIAIPGKKKQTNGAVYTPKEIKEYITQKSIACLDKPLDSIIVSDISCGCGAFLYSLAVHINETIGKSVSSIISDQLFGLDISASSIQRAKILLSLLALSKGEDLHNYKFNLFVGNALEFEWKEVPEVRENKGFDLIIGNPPYVRAKHIEKSSKNLLKNWQVTKSGNPDLYIPFFEIGYKSLNADGVLGYITINSFFKSVNARSLRTYFSAYKIYLEIINFGHEQIFTDKLAYTCICFLRKSQSSHIKYAKTSLSELKNLSYNDFTIIPYESLNANRGWLLSDQNSINNINKIEKCGKPLGRLFTIKNGIATLSNDIYIFKPIKEDNRYYYFEKNGQKHQVEKKICKDIIKPNILKNEREIPEVKEKIIYPYTNGNSSLSLMKEDLFAEQFPSTYQYLLDYKDRLDKRDKGNGNYDEWYAFGRTQALTDKGLKLLFPYMAKRPYFVFTDNKEMLIYCGYAIFSESKRELLVLKKLLKSEIFDYYIQNTSKPYASGYYSYAKNYVKNFGVCKLTKQEEHKVLNFDSKKEIDSFFKEKYDVNI
jgi:hypothetical protein